MQRAIEPKLSGKAFQGNAAQLDKALSSIVQNVLHCYDEQCQLKERGAQAGRHERTYIGHSGGYGVFS